MEAVNETSPMEKEWVLMKDSITLANTINSDDQKKVLREEEYEGGVAR